MLPTILALLLVTATGDADTRRQLERLGSALSHERLAAERWLAAHLGPADRDLVAAAARSGDAEVRRRLARALSLADVDLRVSADLLVAPDPVLAELGARAVAGNVTRWDPEAWRPGLHDQPLDDRLRRLAEESWPQVLRLPVQGTLEEAAALLSERGRLPLPLAVDPALATRLPEPGNEELVGTWDEVVQRIGEVYRVGLDGHGFDPDPDAAASGAFLRFVPPTRAGESAVDLCVDWCRTLARSREPEARDAAARALGAAGWPGGLAWLEARVDADRDEAALEGLLRASAGGRMMPILRRPEILRRLLAVAEEDLVAGDPTGRALRILAALRPLRGLGAGGANLAPTVLEGWDAAGPAGRWLRLNVLGKMRAPEGAAVAAACLADPARPAFLRLQALRTWTFANAGRPGLGAPPLERPEDLLAFARTPRAAVELARLLHHAGLAPPEEWLRPQDLPADLPLLGRGGVLAWYAVSGASASGAETLGRHWLLMLGAHGLQPQDPAQRGAAVGAVLAELGVEEQVALREGWAWARANAGDRELVRALDRSALLADVLPLEDAELALAAGGPPGEGEPNDLAVLGVVSGWGAHPAAQEARRRLAEHLRVALEAQRTPDEVRPLLAALDRSVLGLRRHGWRSSMQEPDGGRRSLAELWTREVRRLVARLRGTGLGAHFDEHWPPVSPWAVRDLGRLGRLPAELFAATPR